MVTELKNIHCAIESLSVYNDSANVANILKEMQDKGKLLKEQMVLKIHKYKIKEISFMKNGKEKTCFMTVYNSKGNRFRCVTYDALIEKLYFYYFEEELKTYTINDIYNIWVKDFQKMVDRGHKSVESLKRYEEDYKRFYKNRDIVNKDIEKIKSSELKELFSDLASNQSITRKTLNNAKTLLNHIFDKAVDMDLHVVASRGISTKDLVCKEENNRDLVYTDEERAKIIEACSEEENIVYARAIELHFNLCARIGEIKSLKWSDIDFSNKTLRIQSEVVNVSKTRSKQPERIEQTKSKKESGKRTLKLNDAALNILLKQKEDFPNSEFVFLYNDKLLTTDIYNKVLKRVCKRASVRYMSSHKIRFWSVTHMLENGVPLDTVQRIAGHSSSTMTEHYDRRKYLEALDMNF